MEYTEDQKTEFRNEFAARRRKQLAVAIPMFAIVLVGWFWGVEKLGIPMSVLAPVLILVIVGALVFSLMNWRCPACNKYLGKATNPKFCPHCGVPLA